MAWLRVEVDEVERCVTVKKSGDLIRLTVAVIVASLLTFGMAYRQTITLPSGDSAVIDWGVGELSAIGRGLPPSNAETAGQRQLLARRAAVLDAQRNLLETLSRVHVTSDTTMVNAMANDVVRSRVEGAVQGAVITNEEWDGEIFTVTMAIDLRSADPNPPHPEPEAPPTSSTPTGLVFDVRGLNAVPSLSFGIVTRSGVQVTASGRGFYLGALPGGIGTEVEHAAEDPRVADNPLIVRVLGVADNRIDLIVSDADGRSLMMYLGQRNYFRDGRTLLVMN